MTPSQIKQALNVRVLRADQAERAYNLARATENEALRALQLGEAKLAEFDASYDERIAAFFEKTATGLSPDSLHSTTAFHSDLAKERDAIVNVIGQAQQAVALARQLVAEKRSAWAAATRAADNIGELHENAVSEVRREQERREEMDADELSVARAFRDAG